MSGMLTSLALVFGACLLPVQDSSPRPGVVGAKKWFNHIGEEPSLGALEGRAVLLHFFTTRDKVEKAWWPVLRKYHHEYADRGLMVLALTDDSPGEVERYMQENNLPFAVGAGMKVDMDLPSPFHQVLLDRKLEVYWSGPTNGLWNGKLLKGLKGSRQPGKKACLELHLEHELECGSWADKVFKYCARGDLEKALQALERTLADDRSDADTLSEARTVKAGIEAHVARIDEQLAEQLASGDVSLAFAALEVLVKELEDHDLGSGAAQRLEEARADADLQQELEAAIEYHKIYDAIWRIGLEKNRARLEKLIAEHGDTRAARWARNELGPSAGS